MNSSNLLISEEYLQLESEITKEKNIDNNHLDDKIKIFEDTITEKSITILDFNSNKRELIPNFLNKTPIDQILNINKKTVNFGEVFPGQIIEENIMISNLLIDSKYSFKIRVVCLDPEFDSLDEYVYSMRRPNSTEIYSYNDNFLILLSAKSMSNFKLAIKVPNYKEEKEILGQIDITSTDNPNSSISIPIIAKILIPQLKCEKMIYVKSVEMSVIKLYLKNPRRQDFRLIFKNIYQSPYIVDFNILKNQNLSNYIDFSFFPNQLTMNPNVQSNVGVSIKSTITGNELKNTEINCVLIAKIKNSNVIFAYPLIILVGEECSNDIISS